MIFEEALEILREEKPNVLVVIAQDVLKACDEEFTRALQVYHSQESRYAEDRLLPDGVEYEEAVNRVQKARHDYEAAQHWLAKARQLVRRMEELASYQHSL